VVRMVGRPGAKIVALFMKAPKHGPAVVGGLSRGSVVNTYVRTLGQRRGWALLREHCCNFVGGRESGT